MQVPAAAAAASAGAVGMGLFSYNRENFQFDQGQRFGRFVSARGMANSQVGQYREDMAGLTAMSSAKMDTWQSVVTMFIAIAAALSCAGRIGMHGAAQPGWFCALYSGNIFASVLFNGLALWLSMHGSLRAQCAQVSLLTRKVRLPIPSMSQLDQARNFGSAYENQRPQDMFRVPFMPHPESAPDMPPADDDELEGPADKLLEGKKKGAEKGKKASKGYKVLDPQTTFASTSRSTVPTWIRDEQVIDKGGGCAGGNLLGDREAHEAPEHFKLFADAQEEWYLYDIYSRISMLYGVCCFLFAVTYYVVGTAIAELRGFWISWSAPMIFMGAQAMILRLEISKGKKAHLLPHAEWAGHVAPYLAVIGTTLEYRFWYSPTVVAITWVVVILCFFGHFLFVLRLFDLAWPETSTTEMAEEPGKQWWPKHWLMPKAFSELFILAPPKKLEVGQHDLLHEMEDLASARGGIQTCRRRKGKGSSGKASSSGRRISPTALTGEVSRLDSLFKYWFNEDVWAQVPVQSQKKIHEIYGTYKSARLQVEELGKGNPEAMEERAGQLADVLMEVSDGLAEVKAAHQDISGPPAGNGSAASGSTGAYTGMSPFFGHNELPWHMIRVALIAVAFQWFYMMVISGIECGMGTESLVKPPGEPPWIRDQKLRYRQPNWIHTSLDSNLPDDYRLHSASDAHYGPQVTAYGSHAPGGVHSSSPAGHGGGHGGGHDAPAAGHDAGHALDPDNGGHRRLASQNRSEVISHAIGDLMKSLPTLGWLADTLHEGDLAVLKSLPVAPVPKHEPAAALPPTFMAPALKAEEISWPAFFEPRHLLCRPGTVGLPPAVVALTPRGFGAMAQVGGAERAREAESFALEGASDFGPLAGAAWSEGGLHLVTKGGELLTCPGNKPTDIGTWPCKVAGTPLPLPSSARLAAAAFAEAPDVRTLAIIFEHSPGVVTLFKDDRSGLGWSPAGELRAPPGASAGRASLNFAGEELLVVAEGGEVHRWHLRDGTATQHPAPGGAASREFPAACGFSEGGLVRLALRQVEGDVGSVWKPELITAA